MNKFLSIVLLASSSLVAQTNLTTINGVPNQSITGLTQTPTQYIGPQAVAGCGVEYVSGLTYVVGACQYSINGQDYNSPTTTVTLTAADPTNPRIDVIYVDTTSTVQVLTGTPAATPQQPVIDMSSELQLTFVLIPATATTPANTTATVIYDEATEWTPATGGTSSAFVNTASTNNPFRGTKDTEFGAGGSVATTTYAQYVKPAAGTVDLANYNSLIFYIRNKASWAKGRSVSIQWYNGSTAKGTQIVLSNGTFGFNSTTNTTGYQQIVIPASSFGVGGIPVTTLRFTVSGSGAALTGFYLDAVSLQGGTVTTPPLPTTLMNYRGTWSSTTTYVPNDTVVSGGLGYVALIANTNQAVTNTTYWAALGQSGSSFKVNGVTVSGTPNLSDTTPAATTGNTNVAFQLDGSGNISGQVPNTFNSSATNYVWMGDSRLMIATFNQVTATAASMDGTTVTITLPNVAGNWVDNTALVPGDSVQFFNNASNWSPSCLGWGNGTVLTASATQITVAQNSLGPVTCSGTLSGTGGVIQKANYLVPQLTAREPFFNGHGTTYNMAVPGEATNTIGTTYTNYVHALSPAITGNPGYLILQVGSQNGLGCTAVSTVESQLQTFWATAHADGWTIVMTTLVTAGPTISCPSDYIIDQVNYWLRSQVKGYDQTLTTANKYWDILIDVATYLGDINDTNIFATGSESLHFNNGGTKVFSSLMNLGMVGRGSIPRNPRTGYSVGPQYVDTTPVSSAGYGPGVFDYSAWSSNTTPGIFAMTIDKATPASYVSGFIDPAGNLPMTGFRALPWNGSTVGMGWLMRYNGGYCWLTDTGGAYLSQLTTETCFKRIAAKEVVLGNATTWADASGQLDLAVLKLGVTSDPSSLSNGMMWYNTTTNLLKAYIGGVTTTLGAGGSSAFSSLTGGTNTGAAMVVGTGASLDYTGTGTIDANKLLTNTVPANAIGYLYNNGTGTLSWTLGGNTQVKTTSYTVTTSDTGLIVMDCGSSCTATLPASSIPTGYTVAIQAANSGAVTVDPNGVTIYLANNTGSTSTFTVPQGQTIWIGWDGTAYRATAPWIAGSNVTITPGATGVTIASTATASTAFSALTGSTNTTAAMVVGSGASLDVTGTGTINANKVNGATVPTSAAIAATNGSGQIIAATTTGSGSTAVLATSPTLVTPVLGAATATSLLATGIVDGKAPVDITTGSSATLGGTYESGYTFNQHATAATAITYTLPTAAAGLQYCVANSYNGSAADTGTLEILTSASGQYIIFTDGTLSATGGYVISGGAARDSACVVGVDSTHWMLYVSSGTWTKH